MKNLTPSPLRRLGRVPAVGWLAVFAWSLVATLPAAIDHSITQAAWRMSYGVTAAQMADSAWLSQDADLDGESNGDECAAGTHPFLGTSMIAISGLAIIGNVTQVSFPTVTGKQYVVQKSASLANTGWTPITTALLIGDGDPRTVDVPKEANMFYRVLVQDYDTDGDTVGDYAEQVFHYNPASAYTGGPGGPADAAALLAALSQPSVVTVTPDDPTAAEDGARPGVIMVRRTGGLEPLTIPIAVAGSATPGADYTPLPAAVTLPLAVNSVTLNVTPIPDALAEGGEVVTVTPSAAPGYTLSGPASSSVLITDATTPGGTGLTGRYYDTSNATYSHADNFNPVQLKATRVDPTVDFIWNTGVPTASTLGTAANENWAARFDGFLVPSVTGDHTFDIQADDGARVYVNNVLVIDAWVAGASTTTPMASGAVSLTAGVAVPIRVEYYEMTGSASVSLRWTTPGSGSPVAIPGANVFLDAAVTTNGWTGLYWSNTAYFGLPRFADYPPAINLNWGTGQPAATLPSVDDFSVRWEGYFRASATGNFTFDVQADESAKVYLNDVLIIDASAPGSSATTPLVSAPIALTTGLRYPIRVEYSDTAGNALIKVRYKTPSATSFVPVPVSVIFRVADPLVATTGYWVTYYSNSTGTGKPHYAVQDTATNSITYDYVAGMPVAANLGTAANDNWSARIEGWLRPTTTGNYNFNLQADDGARLYVNDVLVLDGWAPGSAATAIVSGSVALAAGVAVPIRVEYYELNGSAVLNANWKLPGAGTYTLIPAANFFQDAAATIPGLTANYWRNATQTGVIAFTDHPTGLNTTGTVTLNWSSGQPSVALVGTNYSAKWEGYLAPTVTGNHSFDIQASDGARVYLDGNLIIDAWTANSSAAVPMASAPIALAAGSRHALRVEFYDANAEAVTRLRWLPAGATVFVAIPAANIFREATGNGAGYLATYYQNTTLGEPSSHSAIESAITYDFGAGTPVDPAMQPDTFSVRWTGQVQPQYTDEYTFVVNCDDSARLWVNGQPLTLLRADTNAVIDWPTNSTTVDRYARISLVAGQRYDLQLDFYEATGTATCRLYWYCSSQSKEIIPQGRLYPTTVTAAPAMVMSPTNASALVGGPFSYQVRGSNGSSISVTGLPAWLTYSGGVISGTPPVGAEGTYQIVITSTNAAGSSQALLNVRVADTGRTITREHWSSLAGTSIASIPVGTAPTGSSALSSLEGPTDFGEDYGVRIRGYLTAPVSGNYYFWITGSDTAELWISNDDEPINKIKRASVVTGAAGLGWNAEPNQKSAWLALEGGRRYYLEVLHKAATGTGDRVAVGWAKPGEATSDPSEVVPGYALSNYVPPTTTSAPGTLYVATMLSQSGAATSGRGTSTIRVSEDETVAYMTYEYIGLTGPIVSQHIHTDPFLQHGSTIVFDIDTPETPGDGLQPDGTYKWTIKARGTLSVAEIREAIRQGKTYINLHTVAYPNGEIRGNYTAAGGSRTFTPPPAPPAWADDSDTDAGAARFLTQATYGPSPADIVALKAIAPAGGKTRYELWIEDQFTKPASLQLPDVLARALSNYNNPFDESLTYNAWWLNSISGPDQLRQRLAFALSEIMVVSHQGPLNDNSQAVSYYYDKLAENAFGNFRDLLETVSLAPGMGRYLDALRNDKPDKSVGRIPNENYAREIMQLFSIGLFRTWPDGTLQLNSKDQLVPTYGQDEIVGVAHVFTGWDYGYDDVAPRATFSAATNWMRQMRAVPARHFTGPKRILNNEVLPGLATVGGAPLDPHATHVASQYNDPAYQALVTQELDAIHDQLYQHPNTGPYICRLLIQRLVTSHPSRDYLFRVVQKFNDNGAGVRGDMQAVVKAILLDYEARSPESVAKPAFGKQREAVMRVAAAARAFRTEPYTGTWSQNGTRTISVTTSIPHRLVSNNSVFLDYSTGTPLPTPGVHTATVTGTNSYTVPLSEWIGAANTTPITVGSNGTYRQLAGSTTVTVYLSSHWIDYGLRIYLKCLTGPGVGLFDGLQTVTSYYSGSTNSFTFEAAGPAPATDRTGNIMAQRSTASYVVTNSGLAAPNDKRITFNLFRWHNLAVGDRVSVNYSNGNPVPVDSEYVVNTIVDQDTFTVLAPSAGTLLNNQQENTVYVFPHPPLALVRSGNLAARASTYALGATETDISQSPLNAPTVFNYFLPDYKFPGTLASQGLTTPEFEDTSDTNVVRQANFFYNGVFNPSNTNGLSSFRSGSNALVMDLGPWMGNATDLGLGAGTNTTKPWTNNENLSVLIDKLNLLLTGGQIPASGKAILQNFISYERIVSAISVANPCTITTSAPHNLQTGYTVVISGVSGGTFTPTINAAYAVTVTGANTFTVPVSCTSVTGLNLTSARIQNVGYNNTTPTDTNKRDRIRSLIHLILTSADYTIQR